MEQIEYLERLLVWLSLIEDLANGDPTGPGIIYNGQPWDDLEEETDRLHDMVKEGTR